MYILSLFVSDTRAMFFPLCGCHTAGMEYVRTHNLDLARNFLLGALALSPSDPLVLNEVAQYLLQRRAVTGAGGWRARGGGRGGVNTSE